MLANKANKKLKLTKGKLKEVSTKVNKSTEQRIKSKDFKHSLGFQKC